MLNKPSMSKGLLPDGKCRDETTGAGDAGLLYLFPIVV